MIHVLLVDDDPSLGEISRLFLSRQGDISVEVALSAMEGLEKLDSGSFDIIVSDYQMPHIDGIQFLEQVRRRKGKIPFILFTGRGREEIVIRALDAGADSYLQKGGNPKSQFAELTHKIRQVVQKSWSEKLLSERDTHLNAILESTADGILAVDTKGRVLKANSRFADIWHIPKSVLETGDDKTLLGFVLDQITNSDAFLKKVESLYSSDAVDMDTVALRDGRIIERYSSPIVMGGALIGRVWSFRDVTERKHVEEILLKSEARLKKAEEVGSSGSWEFHLNDHAVRISDGARILYGLEATQLTIEEVQEVPLTEYRPRLDTAMRDLISGKSPYNVEFKIRRRTDGKILDIHSLAEYDPGRNIVFGIIRDITEWKRIEEELQKKNEELSAFNEQIAASEEELRANFDVLSRQEQELRMSEEKFRSLVEYSLEGIVILDFQGKIIFSNNAAASLIEFDPGTELTGRNVMEFIAPESREDVIHDFAQIAQGRDAYLAHYSVISAKGKKISVESIGKVIQFEGEPADLVSLRDITERELAEKALWEHHSQMRALIDNLPFDTWAMDLSGKYVLQNPVSIQHWGNCIGKPASRVPLPDGLLEHWLDNNKKAFEGNPVRAELSVPSEGDVRIYDEIVAPVFVGNKVDGIIGVNIDITGRKRAEEALRRANKRLGLLSGITRHDIRNQVIALRGAIDLIDRDKLDKPAIKLIDIAKKAAETIHDQIEFTKEYEELGVKEARWQDINGIFRSAAQQFLMENVSVDLPSDNYEIFADPLLEKVFYNLIDNTLRHGGKVTRIGISYRETGQGLEISVQDNGVGVPDKDKKLIFEQDFGRNTGLGLFLSRDILSITGISINETGTSGSGARFEMIVPDGGYRTGA